MSKKLAAYFSASGMTAAAAKTLSEAAGAVIREGKLLNGRQSKEDLAAWGNSLTM